MERVIIMTRLAPEVLSLRDGGLPLHSSLLAPERSLLRLFEGLTLAVQAPLRLAVQDSDPSARSSSKPRLPASRCFQTVSAVRRGCFLYRRKISLELVSVQYYSKRNAFKARMTTHMRYRGG